MELSIRPFRCVHPFVSTLPSYLLFLSFRFNSHLTFHRKLENMQFARKVFFSSFQGWGHSGWYLPSKQPLAATCGHLQPLAATCGHLRPLAATCGHSSGCKWLQVAANNANGCKWRCSGNFKSVLPGRATGHVRPRAATCGPYSGHLRPLALAATCGHLRPLEWLQVAAFLNISNTARFATSMITRKRGLYRVSCMTQHIPK